MSSQTNSSLSSATLSKALTKPPPLSSILSKNVNLNGSLSTANSSVSSSPSILQQQPLIGSNLIAQSKKSLELSNLQQQTTQNGSNLNLSTTSLPPLTQPTSTQNLFNSLPSNQTTQHLFSNSNNQTKQSTIEPSIAANTLQNQNFLPPPVATQPQQHSPNQFKQNITQPTPASLNNNFNHNLNRPPGPSLVNGPKNNYQQQTQPLIGPPPTGPSLIGPPTNALNQFAPKPPLNNTYPTVPTIGAPPMGPSQYNSVPAPSLASPQPTNMNSYSAAQQQTQSNSLIGPPPTMSNYPVSQQQVTPGSSLIGPPPTMPSYNTAQPQQQYQQTQPTSLIGPPPSMPNFSVNPQQQQQPLGPSLIGPPPTTPSQYLSNQQQQQQPQTKLIGPPPTGPSMMNTNNQINNNSNSNQLINQFNKMNLNQSTINNQPPNIQQQNRAQPNAVDLLRDKKLIQIYNEDYLEPPRPQFPHEFYTNVNCHPDTIRCTLTSIPETQQLLNKSRLPLGILIHPFKDLESLKVVQSSIIVRCRNCRSYINPFVHFIDNSKWRCNLCYSMNDLPEEFLFDPVTRTYGDPSKRPEINSSTIEFIAPPEYTLRPPPPAMYLYLLDVSHNAINTGYLNNFCETLIENLEKIPGDSRAQIGFITYNTCIHFYNLTDSAQPKMMIYPDLEELILPMPDSLLCSLNENRDAIQNFLQTLPNLFLDTFETDSALGTALGAAFQLLKQTGGRITIMQTCLPNIGIGSLKQRDESIDKDSSNLAPQNDFYKKFALDCAGAQIAVDMFMLNSLNADLATLSCVSKYSGGEIKYYPGYHPDHKPEQVQRFCADFKRYLTRKIGFEAVMRIRCTRGMAIHTFHGNFFVRSTDLLALPNVNPDAGFGMQVNIEESLNDISTVCFQAAVLYTSSKSERRIRIHTYCLPVTKNLNEIVNGADQEAIIGLISKMAVDRTALNSLKEAREAMINVAIDYLQAYSQQVTSHRSGSLISPYSLRLIPLYVLGLMKNTAFKFGIAKMDDRVYAMNLFKTMPLKYLILSIYPHLYAVHNMDDKCITDSYDTEIYLPPRAHLSSENIDRHGIYIMDCGESIYMWIGRSVSDVYLQQVFEVRSFNELPDHLTDLPELETELSEKIRNFLAYLYDSRPFGITFLCFKEGSQLSSLFFQHLHDDKSESSLSYYEFLRHLNDQINS